MASVKNDALNLDLVFFSTPEQKIIRLLLSNPQQAFTIRAIASKLKNVKGLGGNEGISRLLIELQSLGIVDFVDHHRGVRLQNDNPLVHALKKIAVICDLEELKKKLEPVSSKGILYGSHATGQSQSKSAYELFVVSESPDEVRKLILHYPLRKKIELSVWTPELYEELEKQDPGLLQKISGGLLLWG